MNCNCIKESADRLYKHFSEKLSEKNITVLGPDASYGCRPGFVQEAITFGGGPYSTRLFHEFEYYTQFTKKDQTLSKPKKNIANMFPSFCPFCGKRAASLTKTEAKADSWYKLLGDKYAEYNGGDMKPHYFYPQKLDNAGMSILLPTGIVEHLEYSWFEIVSKEELEADGLYFGALNGVPQVDDRTPDDEEEVWDDDDEDDDK